METFHGPIKVCPAAERTFWKKKLYLNTNVFSFYSYGLEKFGILKRK